MDKMNITEFASKIVSNLEERYKIYSMTPEELLGKKVISIRSGFTSSGGGQIMLIDSIEGNNVHFKPTEESININKINHLGWGCGLDELPHSVILYSNG
jgi:hypothetical protein